MGRKLASLLLLAACRMVPPPEPHPISDAGAAPAPTHLGATVTTNWSGDLDGSTYSSQIVTGLEGKPLVVTSPTSGQPLTYNGTSWVNNGTVAAGSVAPGTAGQFFVTNATPAAMWTGLCTVDLTHGNLTAGGTGSDGSTIIGTRISGSTLPTIYLLSNGVVAGTANWAVQGDGANLVLNSVSGSGNVDLSAGNATYLIFNDPGANTAVMQAAAGMISLSISTAAGQTLALQGGDSTGITTSTGAWQWTTRTITGNLTVDTTTTDHDIYIDTTGGAITVTLPTPTNGRELVLIDKKNNFGTNNLTLARHASEKINGIAASLVYSANGTRAVVHSDGTDWYTY